MSVHVKHVTYLACMVTHIAQSPARGGSLIWNMAKAELYAAIQAAIVVLQQVLYCACAMSVRMRSRGFCGCRGTLSSEPCWRPAVACRGVHVRAQIIKRPTCVLFFSACVLIMTGNEPAET
jgi:hypothetical protein